jgi:hypothetical protein
MRRLPAQLIVLAMGAGACADLEPIDAGICGNLIIEPGEDCDGDDALGVCRSPFAQGACHYDCTQTACPTGLVCGTGRICLPEGICGNGVVEGDEGEDCDGDSALGVCRPAGQAGQCRFDCTTAACPPGFRCLETGVCSDENVCGNGIIEEANTEDCDGESEFPCRPSGVTGGCRYDCSESPEVCPPGYGCGVDAICRRPSGTFVGGTTLLGETVGLALGDFDGDGRGDIVQVALDGFHIHFLTASGNIDDTAAIQALPAPPVVGDLTGEGRDDLAFRLPSKFLAGAGEIAAFLSAADRTLAPVTQFTENLPGFGVALDVLPPATGDDLAVISQDVVHGYSFEADVAASGPQQAFGVTALLQSGMPPESSLLGVTAADFRRSTLALCEELAIAWRDTPNVVVITPCRQSTTPDAPPWNDQVIAPTVVTLPSGQLPWSASQGEPNPGGALFAGDVNGDGNPDLLVPTSDAGPVACVLGPSCTQPDLPTCTCMGCVNDGTCASDDDRVCDDCAGVVDGNFPAPPCDLDAICEPEVEGCGCPDCAAHPLCPGPSSIQVAYAVGDGSFHPSLPLPSSAGDNETSPLPLDRVPSFSCPDQRGPLGSELLASADLDGDGRSDLVTALGVYVSTATGELAYTFCPQERWVEVTVADFDGNGTLDLVASSGSSTLDYVSGAGDGTFSSQALPAGGFPTRLVAADFDGDTLGDVAFLRSDLPGPAAGNLREIAVAFGRPFAAPSAPKVVGRARDVARLVAGRLLFGDSAAELMVQRVSMSDNAAFLRGSIARQLVSPLGLRAAGASPFATHAQVLSLEGLVHGRFRPEHAQPPHLFVLAALSARFGAEHRVELVSNRGEELEEWHNAPFDCLPPAGPCPLWRLAAVDLDGDDVDSLVAFRDDEAVIFAEASLVESERITTGLSMYSDVIGRGRVHEAAVGAPQVVDIDADGLPDVALLSAAGDVHVFWNQGDGSLSPDHSTVVAGPAPPGEAAAIRAFALLQSGGDDALELAAVSGQGVILHALEPGSRNFAPATAIDGTPAGDLLVAGDVNGDGVDDLVVGSALGFTIVLGVAVLP